MLVRLHPSAVALVLALAPAVFAAPGCSGGGGGASGGGSGSGGGASPPATAAHPLRAGTGVADITPPIGVPLGGFGEGPRRLSFPDLNPFNYHFFFAPSTGVRDPLLAKALVLDDGLDRVAIVSLDMVACAGHAMHKVAQKLAARGVAIVPEHILACASHTHSGSGAATPLHFWEIAAMDLYQPAVLDGITTGIADAIERAVLSLEDAKLGIGVGHLVGITENRRAGVSPISQKDDIDPDLGVIRVDRMDGSAIATVYNYAIHGLVFWWDNMEFSADVMGDAGRYIEARGGGVALFVNGAEGDINPDVGHGDAASLAAGAILGQAALDERARIATTHDVDIASAFEIVDMGQPHIYLDASRLQGAIPGGFTTFLHSIGGIAGAIPLGPDFMDREFRFQAVRLHNAVIASVPGEAIKAVGDEIKAAGRALGYDPPLVFGLANGHMAYITTLPEYMAGGYEGLATLFGPDTGLRVRDQCERMMRAVR